jgi:hypothetical protein
MAFGEAEASRLLGLQRHQLRDARLRGEVAFSRGPGNRVLYQRSDLERYLLERREGGARQQHTRPARRGRGPGGNPPVVAFHDHRRRQVHP